MKPVPRAFHRVITDKGWSYVVGPTIAGRDGPWRYGWEAQELADRLNGINVPQVTKSATSGVEPPQAEGSRQ